MAFSFSAAAKAEIAKLFPNKKCCAMAEAYGVLLFCNSFRQDGIRIITESREFAGILPKLFRKAFGLSFDILPDPETTGKQIFQIQDAVKLALIMDCYGFDMDSTLAMHINIPIVEEECCKTAFLRGAFLAGGSATDPGKGYHLELSTTHGSVGRECNLLMSEVLGFYPKTIAKNGGSVLYLKQSEQIADFFTYLGATSASMGIMEARLEKEMNNRVNRCVNCDDANISKVIEASQVQINAIRRLMDFGILEKQSEKLQQAASARMEHPESSLTELAAMMEPPITKPAMNHRMKKLMELAKEAGA